MTHNDKTAPGVGRRRTKRPYQAPLMVEYGGERMTARELAERAAITVKCLRGRWNRGLRENHLVPEIELARLRAGKASPTVSPEDRALIAVAHQLRELTMANDLMIARIEELNKDRLELEREQRVLDQRIQAQQAAMRAYYRGEDLLIHKLQETRNG